MSLWRTIETGLRGLSGHRLRSVLTTLGILFGVAAVITTVGIGQASSNAVNARISALGTNLLTISPGSTVSGGVFGGGATANTLTMEDVRGLADRGNAPDVQAVAPVVQARKSIVSAGSNWSTQVQGSTPGWLVANARTVGSGRFFTDAEVRTRGQVVLLGTTTAAQLGVGVGDAVTIGPAQFQVIGLLASSGGQGFQNGDDMAMVPITTAQDELTGGNANSVSRILLSASSADTIGSAYQEASALLTNTHHVGSGTADFTIQSQSNFLSTAQSITTTLTILLASVAAISLLVGGIGVMNIMLVSVTERTSEIGLRKALGARPGDILRQFLFEAAALSILGGLLGVALALLAAQVLPRVSSIAVAISPAPVLIAVTVAGAVGLVFGVYPATRAARLAPIEALRAQ
ncbi:MAG: ABC transporter permease [Candidatus Dormibacteria bacterium]